MRTIARGIEMMSAAIDVIAGEPGTVDADRDATASDLATTGDELDIRGANRVSSGDSIMVMSAAIGSTGGEWRS
jgi:hypothetical protein